MTAQEAYEEDASRHPNYDGGAPRKKWSDLPEIVRKNWAQNPTPRDWNTTTTNSKVEQ